MADLDTIRALTGDQSVYVKEQVDLVALAASIQVSYAPLVSFGAHGVTVTLESGVALNFTTNPFTLDLQTGVLTFTGTVPAAQMLTVEYWHVSQTDESIQIFLDLEAEGADPIRLAAADALDATATSEALIQKKIKLLDMDTDGAAVAKALRDHAQILRKLVFDPDFVEATFDFAEQLNLHDHPAWVEKITKDVMRESA